MLVDVHCHLQDEAFSQDLEKVIQRAKDAGVSAVITSTQSFSEIEEALRITTKYPNYVYLTVGCSPILFDRAEIERIQRFIRGNRDKVVGIGEVGLDYYWEKNRRELQVELFKEWIALAKEVNLPIIVHSRSAGKYAIELLLSSPPPKVVLHAFDGKVGWAKIGEEAGFKFSIPTSIALSRQRLKLVSMLRIDSMLLETDSPVLSPLRGERNEPCNLKYALEKVSEIKKLSHREAEKIITETTLNFFI
ncbi:MAG: TatD family hydrolase [bacterium]|nr:TatD family hydrolase [bacterium]